MGEKKHENAINQEVRDDSEQKGCMRLNTAISAKIPSYLIF